ncbi:hypothetical protein PVAP13_9KG609450 [Panicum virgatum]|uniref:Uncharacterized protein n=1 Tax=Panicum virgatum TaxID=38727 RepID=A0A8T0NXS9_PANVG|nr:hypothetical protein PVAP13_9KG609450 [Panicum virgatum]
MPRHLPPAPDTNPPRSPHSPRAPSAPPPPTRPFPFSSPPPRPGLQRLAKLCFPFGPSLRSRFEFSDLPAGDPYI